VKDGAIVNVGDEVNFGFVVSVAPNSNSTLSNLIVRIDDLDNLTDTIDLIGKTTYTYQGTIVYSAKDQIIGNSTIKAIVTDATGKTATASINLSINQPAQPLVGTTFSWYRLGNTQTGLEEYGLYWEKNIKDTHAQIKPLEGVTLFSFDPSSWEATTTDIQKATLFAEGATALTVYNNVSTTVAGTYDDVIGTKMANGTLHLIHVTKCEIGEYQSAGYPITISGEAK